MDARADALDEAQLWEYCIRRVADREIDTRGLTWLISDKLLASCLGMMTRSSLHSGASMTMKLCLKSPTFDLWSADTSLRLYLLFCGTW